MAQRSNPWLSPESIVNIVEKDERTVYTARVCEGLSGAVSPPKEAFHYAISDESSFEWKL